LGDELPDQHPRNSGNDFAKIAAVDLIRIVAIEFAKIAGKTPAENISNGPKTKSDRLKQSAYLNKQTRFDDIVQYYEPITHMEEEPNLDKEHISTSEEKHEEINTRIVDPKDRKSIISLRQAFEQRNSRKPRIGRGATMTKAMQLAKDIAIGQAYTDTMAAEEDHTNTTAWQEQTYVNNKYIWNAPIHWISNLQEGEVWGDYPTMAYCQY
jgi:hypothetical protein